MRLMSTENGRKQIFGVVGGMGPLASAEFLKTIYEYGVQEREQQAPFVILYSDPGFPDRTEAFLSGVEEPLLERLILALSRLIDMGVSKTVICCVTIHYLLPKLPDELKSRVISLLDVIFESVARKRGRSLLLCSSGTREMKIFESHPQWESLKDRVALPSPSDQNLIHKFIYEIKKNADVPRYIPVLESLLTKYEVDSFIVGCTEIHLLARQYMEANADQAERRCIDPLTIIAKSLAGAADID